MQLARRTAQSRQDQDLRHHRPGNLFSSCRQRLFQKIKQPNLPAQMQPDPWTAKSSLPLHRNPLQIDFDPLWFNILEQSSLRNGRGTRRLLVNPQTSRSIHLPEVGDDTLPRTTRGAIALDQSPVAMTLALLRAIAAAQVHEPMLQITASYSSGLVFTTNTFTHTTQRASSAHDTNNNVRKPQTAKSLQNVPKKFSGLTKLRKLG